MGNGDTATPVIVTGGASGIGKACARALAQAGRPVAVWDLDAGAANSVAKDIATEFGVATAGVAVDVRDLAAMAAATAASRSELGAFGGMLHAAGVDGVGPLEQLTPELWAAVMDVNLRALPFLVQQLLPDLKSNAGSAIVGIASINATLGNAGNPTYSASKSGLLGLIRALADDLAQHDIRINAISPGQIDTPMLQKSMSEIEGLRQSFEKRIFLGRLGHPEEIASAARFLLSDEASYITGQELIVDGGNVPSQR
ncbi:MAG: SDR family oxidoreductase [Deltaproteobacteria bacterium]|nr:SDR family oxidoreductase [Deltaproteobacteria bacterium]MBW2359282.1 SDR family oxidoreductase [Deltaproteobacteria bacterium]